MKHLKGLLLGSFFAIVFASGVYATEPDCPTTNCTTDCGASGTGCQITQYINGVVCSSTICHGKKGKVE